jgi:hypothetical protein
MTRADTPSLAAVQARLQRLISGPEGVEVALAAAGDASASGLAELVRGDRGLAPAARLSVYANAFFARLHDCLREDFGALARALGPAGFHDLVKTYLMVHPPRQPSLRHAGAHVAEHVSAAPFAAIFSRRCAYAADLARLEWAIAEAFSAADAPVLAREALAAVAPEDFGGLRFELAPSLRLLACDWPVHRVRERFDHEAAGAVWDAAPELAAEPTWLLVFRPGERVRYRALRRPDHAALAAARAGETFAAICERLAAEVGDAQAAARAAELLSSWIGDGLLARVRLGADPGARSTRS